MFYHKFITIDYIIEELDTLNLSQKEKQHLSALLDSAIHHAVFDRILSHLNQADKKAFLQLIMNNEKDDKILDFLNKRVENIERKIQSTADELIKELHKDVKEAKKGGGSKS